MLSRKRGTATRLLRKGDLQGIVLVYLQGLDPEAPYRNDKQSISRLLTAKGITVTPSQVNHALTDLRAKGLVYLNRNLGAWMVASPEGGLVEVPMKRPTIWLDPDLMFMDYLRTWTGLPERPEQEARNGRPAIPARAAVPGWGSILLRWSDRLQAALRNPECPFSLVSEPYRLSAYLHLFLYEVADTPTGLTWPERFLSATVKWTTIRTEGHEGWYCDKARALAHADAVRHGIGSMTWLLVGRDDLLRRPATRPTLMAGDALASPVACPGLGDGIDRRTQEEKDRIAAVMAAAKSHAGRPDDDEQETEPEPQTPACPTYLRPFNGDPEAWRRQFLASRPDHQVDCARDHLAAGHPIPEWMLPAAVEADRRDAPAREQTAGQHGRRRSGHQGAVLRRLPGPSPAAPAPARG